MGFNLGLITNKITTQKKLLRALWSNVGQDLIGPEYNGAPSRAQCCVLEQDRELINFNETVLQCDITVKLLRSQPQYEQIHINSYLNFQGVVCQNKT